MKTDMYVHSQTDKKTVPHVKNEEFFDYSNQNQTGVNERPSKEEILGSSFKQFAQMMCECCETHGVR